MGRVTIACALLVLMGNFSLSFGCDWKQLGQDTYIDMQSIFKSGEQITVREKQYQMNEEKPEFTYITNMTIHCAENKVRINSFKVYDVHNKVIHTSAESPEYRPIDAYSTDEKIREQLCK